MKKEDLYARMMHSPDDAARAELRAALRETWIQLLPLHRALIESARKDYTSGIGEIGGPGHLLQLLQDEPFFAWLRPLTSLIVEIDTMSRTDFEPAAVAAIGARLEQLFGNQTSGDFASRYVPVLQRDVDVAIGHAAVRQLLPRLRPASPGDVSVP